MTETETATNLPAPVARRGLDEFQWRTLKTSIFPGASSESILMAVDYCKARRLDPLKRVVHIVPMYVKDAKSGNKEWRDVVMPGIAEARTTAFRTGQYAGCSKPVFGPAIDYKGVSAPEWCEVTVTRMLNGYPCAYTATVFFREIVGEDKEGVNRTWTKRPYGQLAKCTEAAALRMAFPEELGNDLTAEEMHGKEIIDSTATRIPDSEQAQAATVEKLKALRESLHQQQGEKDEAPAAAPTE